MKQKRLLTMLALLLMAVTGAWAQDPAKYKITVAEGTEDVGNWIVPTEAAEGAEVTVTYSGEKKVKSVKAVKKAAASFTEVTTFSELQTALSAGKNVKLMNDIVCTAGIEITSNGALTIDGNGKKLTLNKGISLASGATLTIQGNGTMVVNGTNNSTASTVAGSTGTLILTSGTLTAKGGNGAEVDVDEEGADYRAYAGGNAINGNVTVSGGTLTAIGGNGGSIGDYSRYSYGAVGGVAISGSVTVTDGTVTATGGNGGSIGDAEGANGGSGGAAIGGNATVNGGTWTASDGTHGANGNGQGGDGGKAVAGTVATYTLLSTITADYEAKDGETLTGTLASNVKISIADGATVTLKNVNITNLGDNCDWAGINCPGDATLVLEGTNTVCAGRENYGSNNYPGIWIATGKTLTIQGDGTLTAYSHASNPYGAGIGGGFGIACGNIVINSGNITATGGQGAAGIGGGRPGSCGAITISGGTITATGGEYAAGIGSGDQSSCGAITISGGTVTATGGKYGAGIGGGDSNGDCGNITITSGVTSVTATKGGEDAQSIGAGEYGEDITVNIEAGANVTQN